MKPRQSQSRKETLLRRIAVLGFITSVLAAASADCLAGDGNSPELAAIIAKCRKAVSQLGYVRYPVDGIINVNGTDIPRLHMTWQEEGEKCRYDYLQREDDGSSHFALLYSFDGMQSLRTFVRDGKYILKRGMWELPPPVQCMEFITVPYEFLVRRQGVPAWQHPNIALLQAPGMWDWLAKNATVTGHQKYRDRDCVVVRVDNTADQWQAGIATHYVVYFDAKSSTPVAWKEFDAKERLISEMDVTAEQTVNLGKGASYVAPRNVVEVYYNFQSPADEPTTHWRFEFGDISVNPADGAGFSLDMMNAQSLYDEDLDKWLPVPNKP